MDENNPISDLKKLNEHNDLSNRIVKIQKSKSYRAT